MKRLGLILFAALVVGFLAAMVGLMSQRLETGDVYPPYSSLRGDPLGAKALAESLDKLDGITVERWHKPRLEPKPAAVFILGVSPNDLANLPDDAIKELRDVLDAGGRIIISLTSQIPAGTTLQTLHGMSNTGLFDEWDFTVKTDVRSPSATRDDVAPDKEPTMPRDALPETIAWQGHLGFPDTSGRNCGAWSSVYSIAAIPVIMERKIGQGSVVLLADSYLLSNEAMHKPADRHPALLVALLGGHTRVIFDEYHLGIGEDPNVATLGRKHGLHWALACLVLLAGLFVWKRVSPLLPPPASPPRPDVTGRSSMDGLVNLLRRSVPASHVLHTCVDEWLKTPAGGPTLEKRLPRVMQIMKDVDEFEDKQRDVIGSYNEIVEAMNDRKPGERV
ncbi:MAG: DUF4350 domain-containing protein [Phycisphaerae bacterium]|nr:DUF4350 domain-containing protein [Phycisphaerae bacterium]